MIIFAFACSMGLDSIVAEREVREERDPVEESLAGLTFEVDLEGVTWIEPAGMGDALVALDFTNLLVHVIDDVDQSLALAVALSDGLGGQDACEPVHQFPEGDFSRNPYFEVATDSMAITLGGQPAAFQNFAMSGVFDTDGTAWNHGQLSTLLDVRELSQIFEGQVDACELAEGLGGTCEACDDGVDACIQIVVEDVEAFASDAPFDPDIDASDC